jgi:hypothetical protein
MHYHTAKGSSPRLPLRKVAAALLDRRSFPAWIDAGTGVPFTVSHAVVTPRVRDSLILRLVAKRPSRTLSDDRHVA